MRIPAAFGQARHGLSFFERPQVLALNVLDERNLDNLGVVDFPDHDRELPKPDAHGRLVAALTGDDLIPAAALPDNQRLDDALLGDRRHELREIAHDLPGLIRRIDETPLIDRPDGVGRIGIRVRKRHPRKDPLA